MAGFVTWIELQFRDKFSQGLGFASKGITGLKTSLESLARDRFGFDNAASQMSMMAMNTRDVQATFTDFAQKPKELLMAFEDNLAPVKTVMNEANARNGDLAESLDFIKQSALSFSQAHRFSTDQYLDNVYQMIGAGLNVNQSIAGTEQALKLARATMGTTSEAVSLLADMYNNMGDKTNTGDLEKMRQEMGRLSDVIAMTQNAFKITNLGQLNDGLKYGVPYANAYKISIEQLSTVIGQLNNTGLAGTLAGTGFKSMVSQMSRAERKIGFEVVLTDSGGMDLIATIGNMKDRFNELSRSAGVQKTTDMFQRAFGAEAFGAVSNLMTQFDDLKKNYTTIQNSLGTTENAYTLMADTVSTKLQIIEQREDALKIKVGELAKEASLMGMSFKGSLLTIQEELMKTPVGQTFAVWGYHISGAGNAVFGFASATLTMVSQILMIASITGHAKGIVGLFTNSIRVLGSSLMFVTGGITKFVVGTGMMIASQLGLIPAVTATASAEYAAAVATWAWLGPVLLIIAAVALLALGGYLLVKNWDTVKAFFVNLWGQVVKIFKGAWDFIWNNLLNNKYIQTALAVFLPFIGLPVLIIKNWKSISGFFVNLWTGVVSFFKQIPGFFAGVFQAVANNKYIQLAFSVMAWPVTLPMTIIKNWSGIVTFFKNLFSEIATQILKPFKLVDEFIDKISGKKNGKLKGKPALSLKTSLETVPSFDSGVRNFSGGLAYVHRDELLELPEGSNVYNRNETRKILSGSLSPVGSDSGKTINITIHIDKITDRIEEIKRLKDFVDLLANVSGVQI
jgi:TP901 family phage tail tape measure protein